MFGLPRWAEWYLMLFAVTAAARRLGRAPRAGRLKHAWVAGGVALSVLTDVPVIFLLKHLTR